MGHQQAQQLRGRLPRASVHMPKQRKQQLLPGRVVRIGGRKGAPLRRSGGQHGTQRRGVQLAGCCRQQRIL